MKDPFVMRYNERCFVPLLLRIGDQCFSITDVKLESPEAFKEIANKTVKDAPWIGVAVLDDEVEQLLVDIINDDEDIDALKKENEELRNNVRKHFKMCMAALNDLDSRDMHIRELNEVLGELDIELQGLQAKNSDLKDRLASANRHVKHGAQVIHERNVRINDLKESLRVHREGSVNCSCCGKPMVIRTNSLTGGKFWGCSNYPTCKHTRNYGVTI